jgi:hypothetical protein
MTKRTQHLGVEFRVRSYLKPLLTRTLCFKRSHVKILSITIFGLLIIGVYPPDGKDTKIANVLPSILDKAVMTGYQSIIAIRDPNAKTCALGDPPRIRNKAGRVLDYCLKEADCVFKVIPSPQPT